MISQKWIRAFTLLVIPALIFSLFNSAPTNGAGASYTTSSNIIYKNGTAIQLKGVNWFGFETNEHTVHGLWARNWKEMIQQMKTLGFNAVRIPFCPAVLQSSSVGSIDYSKNQDLQGLNSLQLLDKIVDEFNNQQMYILLDHHRPDCNAISELWYVNGYSEEQWINDLKSIAQRYKDKEYVMGIDLKNEPHGNVNWGSADAGKDWKIASEKAGQAILSVNPNVLIFVEGIQENSSCSSQTNHWWGGNLEPVNCSPIDTNKIPANKLVFSPHVYGPDVYDQPYFSTNDFPNNMPAIWDAHFGYLLDKGYTVVPGEWGGKYGNNGGKAKDPILQNKLTEYFKNKKICSSFYWDWNPNSGDTGGILQDDWTTPWQNKVDAVITNYFNACQASVGTTSSSSSSTSSGGSTSSSTSSGGSTTSSSSSGGNNSNANNSSSSTSSGGSTSSTSSSGGGNTNVNNSSSSSSTSSGGSTSGGGSSTSSSSTSSGGSSSGGSTSSGGSSSGSGSSTGSSGGSSSSGSGSSGGGSGSVSHLACVNQQCVKVSGAGNNECSNVSSSCTNGGSGNVVSPFKDLPTNHWAFSSILQIFNNGVTKGCGNDNYCPAQSVTRAQMATFLERVIHGGNYAPPQAKGLFQDVPTYPLKHWAADFIEQLYSDKITKGCLQSPLRYCPDRSVTRAEMAVLLLRVKYGENYNPPAISNTHFNDVGSSFWAASWIEKLSQDGITTGCGNNNFCPNQSVNRAEMAAFLVRTFGTSVGMR